MEVRARNSDKGCSGAVGKSIGGALVHSELCRCDHVCCAHSLLYMLALCGSSVRDGISDVCSNDDSQSRVHGRIGEGSVCSVTMYCEFESDQ